MPLEIESTENGGEWVEPGVTCSNCGYRGTHLAVDNEFLYCGRCETEIDTIA